MKKYLQACEIGGSIYGKEGTAGKKVLSGSRRPGKADSISAHNRLYRAQFAAMRRVFRGKK